MIYILIGEEDFLIEENLEKIGWKNKAKLSFKDKDFKFKFNQFINRRLFGEDVSLILTDLDKIDLKKEFLQSLRDKNVALIFKQNKPEVLIKKLKDLKIPHIIETIPSLKFKKPEDFEKFLLEYLQKINLKIPQNFLKSLAQIFLHSPVVLLNELKKIRYYKTGNQLTKEELVELIRWPTDSQFFALLDSFLNKDFNNFVMRFQREILIGTKAESIIGFLAKSFLRLFLAKRLTSDNRKILDLLNISKAYQWRLKQQSKNIKEAEIKKIIQVLAEIDRKYKKFFLKDEEIIYELIKHLKEANI